jgi:hypothetical protein
MSVIVIPMVVTPVVIPMMVIDWDNARSAGDDAC